MPIKEDFVLGDNVGIFRPALVNLYGGSLGNDTKVGAFVEIQKGVAISAPCKISSHTFLCEGVTIEDEVFVGHDLMFTNNICQRATNDVGSLQTEADWQTVPTCIRRQASIGTNATIIAGVVVGERALNGAGAIVTKDVPDFAIVAGVPAKAIGGVREEPGLNGSADVVRP